MLRIALFASALTVASLVSFSNSASAVVLGNFNDANNNEGWTRTSAGGLYNSINNYGNPTPDPNDQANVFFKSPTRGFQDQGYGTLSKIATVGNVGDTINLSFDINSFAQSFFTPYEKLFVFVNNNLLTSYTMNDSRFNPVVFGGFVSGRPFANQTLSFTSQGSDNYSFRVFDSTTYNGFAIDNVTATVASVSQTNVPQTPEPAETLGLLVFGGAAIILKRKINKSQKSV